MKFDDGVVRQVRIGQPTDDVTRVVLEVDGTASHSRLRALQPVPRSSWTASVRHTATAPTPAPIAAAPLARRCCDGLDASAGSSTNARLIAGGACVADSVRHRRARAQTATARRVASPPRTCPSPRLPLRRRLHRRRRPHPAPAAASRAKDASKSRSRRRLPAAVPPCGEPAGPLLAVAPARARHLRGSSSTRATAATTPARRCKGLNEADLVLDVALRLSSCC